MKKLLMGLLMCSLVFPLASCGEKHEHNYVEKITKKATCVAAGEKTFTCECGDAYTEVIEATGEHTYLEQKAREATKTSEGKYAHYKCKDCGGLFVLHDGTYLPVNEEDLIIPMLHSHSITEPVFTWSEDNTSCTVSFECTTCEDYKITDAACTVTREDDPRLFTTTFTAVYADEETRITATKTIEGKVLDTLTLSNAPSKVAYVAGGEEFTAANVDLSEVAIKATFTDGTESTILGNQINWTVTDFNQETLAVTLESEEISGKKVTLNTTVYEKAYYKQLVSGDELKNGDVIVLEGIVDGKHILFAGLSKDDFTIIEVQENMFGHLDIVADVAELTVKSNPSDKLNKEISDYQFSLITESGKVVLTGGQEYTSVSSQNTQTEATALRLEWHDGVAALAATKSDRLSKSYIGFKTTTSSYKFYRPFVEEFDVEKCGLNIYVLTQTELDY